MIWRMRLRLALALDQSSGRRERSETADGRRRRASSQRGRTHRRYYILMTFHYAFPSFSPSVTAIGAKGAAVSLRRSGA